MMIDYPKYYMIIGKIKKYRPSEIRILVEYGIIEPSHQEDDINYYKYCE